MPAGVQARDLSEGVFQPASQHLLVGLRLGPAYAWVADYYPTEDAEPRGTRSSCTCASPTPAGCAQLVLGSAGQVSVLSPDWLAEDVRSEAERALEAYR